VAISRERFEQGMTYDEYKAQMTRSQERFEANERDLEVDPATLAAITGLKQPLNVAVLAEDWCGDVIANLPILGRLARDGGKLNVRVFLRDQNLDLMDQYLNKGQFRSIPTFVFLDGEFQEIGVFKERPDSVTDLRAQRRREIYASDPAYGSPDAPVDSLPEDVRTRLQAAIAAMREETLPYANGEVQRELRTIIERAG
jgi:hypothetical protein